MEGVGGHYKKEEEKIAHFFLPTTSTSTDNGSGGFLGPNTAFRHLLLNASPSLLLIRDMIVIVQISPGEWNGPRPSLPQASTHLYERDLIVATQLYLFSDVRGRVESSLLSLYPRQSLNISLH